MKKIILETEIPDGKPSHEPLMPIVKYSIENGCNIGRRSVLNPFRATPNGGVCIIQGNLTLEDILEAFELPETMIVGLPFANCIWDKKHNSSICFELDGE